MPRLLNVNNYHYRRGGAEVVYFEHARLMEGRGWDNAFFSMHHPKNEPTEWSRYFVQEIEFGHSYSLADKLGKTMKVIYSREAQAQIGKLIRAWRPDVAHLHGIYHHLSPSILSTIRALGVPAVMTAHDLKIACPAYKMLNSKGVCEACRTGSLLNVIRNRCIRDSLGASAVIAAESFLHRRLDSYRRGLARIVAPSRFFVRKFVEWGWDERTFLYVPNFVDADAFDPDYRPGSYFLYFGRLSVEKGVPTLIMAAAKAGVRLVLAGTGPMRLELEALAEALGASAEFVGFKSGADLHQLVRGARAVVLPSEWYENAPISILEAGALGKPVVVADIGGLPEMVVPEATGWLFPSGDVEALAERLRSVQALGADRIEATGRAARRHVETVYNREQYAEAMLSLYASLGVRS